MRETRGECDFGQTHPRPGLNFPARRPGMIWNNYDVSTRKTDENEKKVPAGAQWQRREASRAKNEQFATRPPRVLLSMRASNCSLRIVHAERLYDPAHIRG